MTFLASRVSDKVTILENEVADIRMFLNNLSHVEDIKIGYNSIG
jgi:hypothetical protein